MQQTPLSPKIVQQHYSISSSNDSSSISLVLNKQIAKNELGETIYDKDERGNQQPRYLTGFRVGGGADQDHTKCPFGYRDNGIYVTWVYANSPASRAGLKVHDKLLQVNGVYLNSVSHKQCVELLQRHPVLNLLVHRQADATTINGGTFHRRSTNSLSDIKSYNQERTNSVPMHLVQQQRAQSTYYN